MKKSVLKKFALTAGAAMSLVAGQAFAAASPFTVNQNAIGGAFQNPALFIGTQLSGNASELIRFSASDTIATVQTGFLRFSTIFNQNTASGVSLNTSSTAGNYGLYVLFDFASTYNAGLSTAGAGQAGAQYDITSLNFKFYADTIGDTTFVNADATGAGTNADRTGGFADDNLLAFGSLLSTANPDVAGFNPGGGAFENSLTTFAICTGANTAKIGGVVVPGFASDGSACTNNRGINFFSSPVPFYPLAFNAFNNTGNSLSGRVGSNLAVEQSIGAVSFQAVPEPSSIALVGIATLALSLAGRRRRKV